VAADHIALAWDHCGSSSMTHPRTPARKHAARLVLNAVPRPQQAAVGVSTNAIACTLTALVTGHRSLLVPATVSGHMPFLCLWVVKFLLGLHGGRYGRVDAPRVVKRRSPLDDWRRRW
jgi:hypothetical protein